MLASFLMLLQNVHLAASSLQPMKRATWSGWKMQSTLAFHPGSSGSIGAANFSLDSIVGAPYWVKEWQQINSENPEGTLAEKNKVLYVELQ